MDARTFGIFLIFVNLFRARARALCLSHTHTPASSIQWVVQDPPSPSGRLSDRISVLRQRCVEGLGRAEFEAAHRYLKALQVHRH